MTLNICTSKNTGNPLKTYTCYDNAQQAADYAMKTYKNAMIPYQCNRCHYWHLCPEERYTPSETCHYCSSSDGKAKQLYRTHESAKKRAECFLRENQLKLYIYECPHQSGWHLTKSNSLWGEL